MPCEDEEEQLDQEKPGFVAAPFVSILVQELRGDRENLAGLSVPLVTEHHRDADAFLMGSSTRKSEERQRETITCGNRAQEQSPEGASRGDLSCLRTTEDGRTNMG